MKITHVIESSGGSADFVLYLIKYLPQHQHNIVYGDRTFGQRFATVQSTHSNARFYKWEFVQRELRPWLDFKSIISLYQLLKKIDSEVIHLHSSKAGFLGRIVCFLQGKRGVIYTPNGLAFLRTDVPKVKARLYLFLERVAYWLNGKVISCSRSEAEALINRGIQSSYVSNGTEISDSKDITLSKPSTKIVIATTGRVTIQKNPVLFNAIAKHFEADPRYEFVWIGGGEMEDQLSSKNIRITGWLERRAVMEAVAQADIYISTALWEGLPFAVLEAMNLKKPLLLHACVGNVDLVRNEYNGFLYTTSGEAIERIVLWKQYQTLLTTFGENSRELVKSKFDVVEMAKGYEREYIELTK